MTTARVDTDVEAEALWAMVCEKHIAYNPWFSHITGGPVTGLMLSQLVYWQSRSAGEWWKTDEKIAAECAISIDQVKRAKKQLRDLGLINFERKSRPCRTYYTVHKTAIVAQICSWWKTHQLDEKAAVSDENPSQCESHQLDSQPENGDKNASWWESHQLGPRKCKTHQPVSGKPTNQLVGNPPTIIGGDSSKVREETDPPPIFLPENNTTHAYCQLRESYPTQWNLTFLAWFERHVLGRWDKAKITFAILCDWEKFWEKYEQDIATEALARHKAKHTGWNPKLAKCHDLARMLNKAHTGQAMMVTHADSKASAEAATWPQRWENMTLEEARAEYETSAFARKLLSHNRPDLYDQLRKEGAA